MEKIYEVTQDICSQCGADEWKPCIEADKNTLRHAVHIARLLQKSKT